MTIRSRVRGHALAVVLVSVAACRATPPAKPLPPLPSPDTSTFLPAVREQIEAARRDASARPEDAEAAGRYGMVLEAYDRYDAARICYERAHALDPKAFRWAYHLALQQERAGDRATAIATMRTAVGLRGDYLPARLALSSMLLASGAMEESRALAESAVRDAPASAPAHYAYGRALAALRQHQAAAAQLEEATRIAPGYAAAHYALALVYRDLGRTADGERHIALYEKNRGADPPTDDPFLEEIDRLHAGAVERVRRAGRLYNQGRFPEAAAEYEGALAIGGDVRKIHAALVSTYARMEEWAKAEAHYRAVIAIDPAFPEAHYNFAILKVVQGDHPAAVDAFHKALAADPDDPRTHTQLARVYELTNEPAKAVRHFRVALEKDPRASQTRALLVNRLLAEGKGREALDEMLVLLLAGDVPPEQARAALRGTYPKVGSPRQVTEYLRDARRRAEAGGRAELVAAIDAELAALPGLQR